MSARVELNRTLRADRIARGMPAREGWRGLAADPVWSFQESLRRLEFLLRHRAGAVHAPLRLLGRTRFHALSIACGFTIPPFTFGPGLSIAHRGTIVVNRGARIGANCRIHTGVTIGTAAGFEGRAPSIGDDCYIGPGAKIFGDITIADGTVIGANAVVDRSVHEPNTAVAGVPATKIGDVDPHDYGIPATRLLEAGIDLDGLAGLPAREVNRRVGSLR